MLNLESCDCVWLSFVRRKPCIHYIGSSMPPEHMVKRKPCCMSGALHMYLCVRVCRIWRAVLCLPAALRLRRRRKSTPGSTGWSGQRSAGRRSPRKWKRKGGSFSFRCARSVGDRKLTTRDMGQREKSCCYNITVMPSWIKTNDVMLLSWLSHPLYCETIS